MTQPSTDAPARFPLVVPAGATRCVVVELGEREVRVLLGDLDGRVLNDRSARFPVDADPVGTTQHTAHLLAGALARHRVRPDVGDVAAVVVARRDRAADAARTVAADLCRHVPGMPAPVVPRAVDLAAQAEHRAASAADAAWCASAGRSPDDRVLPVLHVDIDHDVETTLLLDAAGPGRTGVTVDPRSSDSRVGPEALVRRAAAPDATRDDLRRAGVALGIELAREATRTGARTVVLDGRLGSASGTLAMALRATFAEHTTDGTVLRGARLARRAAVLGGLDLATRIAAVRLATRA